MPLNRKMDYVVIESISHIADQLFSSLCVKQSELFQMLSSGCSCCFQNPLVRMKWVKYADAPG
ncbi:MAG: hypothetical protein IKR48_10645, partial [Kiritimatiellae bacterium]|nr:hypothetical protein [Kiritimatiellia bacterium]